MSCFDDARTTCAVGARGTALRLVAVASAAVATLLSVAHGSAGIPAAPPNQCGFGDLDDDGIVDGADLGILLAQWGSSGSADLDGDGIVDGADLGLLLAAWGTVTPSFGSFPDQWIAGGPACPGEPKIQIHHYDANTVILRQSLCTNFEAPFMYLLFGEEKVLLQDTGAGNIPIYATVAAVIDDWLKANERDSIELIVSHSHGHGDHVAGNPQFVGQPNVTMVGTSQTAVRNFFGIASWPQDIVEYDLGGRIIDIIPIPGHQAAHIAVYDRATGILLTGDSLYPGRLYISNFAQYLASIDRLVEFVQDKPICWILGTHIEMSNTPGVDFPLGSLHHPDEHPLQLELSHMLQLQSALHAMAGAPHYRIFDSFIIFPLGGAATPPANGEGGEGDCCDRPKTAFELRRVLRPRRTPTTQTGGS